ncbi:MAG: DUF2809 domain-containing protein [Clostridiales bacterium]|nr:DUF2809 domain-containing protein [Clostridiales bacterium]
MEKRRRRIPPRFKYAVIFLSLFMVEVLIALFARGAVRGYLGDVLVIPAIYFFLRAVFFPKDSVFSIYVLPFLCYFTGWLAEVLQALHVARSLGIESSSPLGIMLGGVYDLKDGLCYLLGLMLIGLFLALETKWKDDRRWFYPVAVFLHWTWGYIQTSAGFFVFLWYFKCRHYYYKGVVRTVWPLDAGVSLGMFIFTPKEPDPSDTSKWAQEDRAYCEEVAIHEYGHTFQSLLLGPFYLLVIGLPSIVWASSKRLQNMRRRKNIPYSRLYCEKWASKWGEKVTKEKADWR